ncbi:hypothetical protein ACER0C_002266 [Sarotherodon galilaeus]
MAAGTSASLCWLIFVVASVSADQKIITAHTGKNVTLTCRATNNKIVALKWSKDDQKQYVLYYRGGKFDHDDQHPSFTNRVALQDRQLKDGDVSLILKNVTINDTGTYECRVAQIEPNQERPSLKLINNINLSVVSPGKEDRQRKNGSVGLKVCLTVFSLLLLLVAVGFAV